MTVQFQTLKDFQAKLEQTEVYLGADQRVKLEEGLQKSVEKIQAVHRDHKKVILVGNGGSAAIASHQAVDLWKNGGVRAVAFNDASLLTCISNDYSYQEVFSKPIEMFADEGDLLIAISSSGKSQNILNAMNAVKQKNIEAITFSGFKSDNPLRKEGKVNYYIPSQSYGIVEIGHLLLIHAIIDEVISRGKICK